MSGASSRSRFVSYLGGVTSLSIVAVAIVIGSITDDVRAPEPLRRDGRDLVRADLHVHTRFSDGLASPFDLVLAARRHGLDAIAVTEHNVVFPAVLARVFSEAIDGPTVLIGQEITSRRQHVGAIGIHSAIEARQPLPAILRAIHAQGGVAVACHPVEAYWPRFDAVLGELDAIEVIHPIAWRASGRGWAGSDLVRYYERARSRGARPAAVGSSDFHFFKMLGLGSTWISSDGRSAEALVRAIREGRTATRGPTGLWYGDAALVRSLSRAPPPNRGENVGYAATSPLDAAGRLLGLLGMASLIALRGHRTRRRAAEPTRARATEMDRAKTVLVAIFAFCGLTSQAHAQDAGVSPDAATPSSGADASTPPSEARAVPPRLLDAPALELPPGSAALPDGASVGLELVVSADGTATEARVITPLRDDVDAAALALVPRLRFEPARRDGHPIAARIRFRFALRAPPAPAPFPTAEAGAADAGAEAVVPEPRRVARADDDEVFESTTTGVRREEGAATRIVLSAEELTTVPGTFGEPLRVVATLPGVMRTPFGIGYFLVRGASFENTGFLVDGFPVPVLYHFGAGPAVISSRLVSRLDFYPGGYPVSYGRFSAGLISLTTAPPPTDRLRLEGEIDLFRASALAVIPFDRGRGSIALAFRRSYYDLILPLIVDGVSLAYADYQVRADYRVSRRLRASVFLFGSDDTLDTSQASDGGEVSATTTSLGTGFHRVMARLSASWPNGATASWAGTIGFDFLSASFREPGTANLRSDGTATYLGQRAEIEVPLRRGLRLSFGADTYAWVYRVELTFPTPPGLGELPRPDFDPQVIDYEAGIVYRGLAGWMQAVVRLGPIEMTPGIRLDGFSYADVSLFEPGPRVVVRGFVGERLVLKAATGLFSQPAQPFQVEASLGNPEMRPLQSWQSSAGIELRLPASIEIESSVFYSAMERLARPNERIELEDGIISRELFTDDGEGRAYGFELLVRRRVERGLYGWLSYTLSRSERFIEGGDTVPFEFDQTHTLNIAASYKLGGWRFGARFTLSSGRPTNDVAGAIFDADSGRYRAEYSGTRTRLPVYHQLDVRIDRDLRLGPVRGSIYLDVLNVYYARNAEGRLYQYDYARSQPLPGLPILATLGLRIEYD